MTITEVLERLDALGAGKARVMMGPLRALGKEIGTDHALALALWDAGRDDARLLATMLMAPDRISPADAEAMLASASDVQLVDELTYKVLARAPRADELRRRWMADEKDLTGRAGWNLLVARILGERMTAEELDAILGTIEAGCRAAPVRTAESMMRCLVEIGARHPEHRPRAIDIGERWGPIDDRPTPKGCTPFYAPDWIAAIVRRKGR